MALRPKIIYPAQTSSLDAAYPHGKARNRATPGDGTGTPWEQALVNDIFGFQQALLVNAGITPSDTPDTALASQYLEGVGHFTKQLNAAYALQFPEITRAFSVGPDYPIKFTSCLDSAFQPWLVFVNSSGRVVRNLGANPEDNLAGDQPAGTYAALHALSGGQDGILIAIEGGSGTTYASGNAGQTWSESGTLPSTGSWTALNYSNELSLWIAVGTNKAAHSPAFASMVWTSASGTGTLGTPRRIVVPRIGETGHGVMVIGAAGAALSFYSLDGLSFVQTTWGTPVADGCWSEHHKRWFILTTSGQLYQAATLNGAWTLAATLWQAGFSLYRRIHSFGRYLMILGELVAGTANRTVGSVLVTDLTWFGSYTVDGGGHDDICDFDGRLVIIREVAGPQVDIALSARAPWLL